MVPSPGTYLQRRREAASKTLADVAQRLSTVPRMAEHARVEWIALVELDAVPAGFSTIAALRSAFPFDLAVLAQLDLIRLGADLPPPRLCRTCACSEYDPCHDELGATCSWVEDDLCSACSHAALLAAVAA